jgi:hypothetical protein
VSQLTRRHLLAGAAATAASAAIPVAAAIEAVEMAPVITRHDIVFAQMARNAWLEAGGTIETFRRMASQAAAALDVLERAQAPGIDDRKLELV